MGLFSNDPEKAAQKEAEKAARDRARADAEFRASPAGQARSCYSRGYQLFQTSFDLQNVKSLVIPMDQARTMRTANDPSEVLNAISREGWNLMTMSTAFVHEGEESRDKFLASGQQTAVRGRLVGTYVFLRRQR